MNTRAQMFLVIFVLVFAFATASSVFLVLRSQATKIENEQQILAQLRVAFLNEGFQANRLAVDRIGPQAEALQEAQRKTATVFARVAGITLLPRLSRPIRKSLVSIQAEKDLLDSATGSLLGAVSTLQDDATALGGNGGMQSTGYALLALDALARQSGSSKPAMVTGYQIGVVQDDITRLTSEVETAIQVIDNQGAVISTEIRKALARSNLIALIIVVVIVAGTFALALRLTDRIVRSVKAIESNISSMKNGDLTLNFRAGFHDEIGRLSANLNDFVHSLNDSITSVQSASAENVRMKESLMESTARASSSVTTIVSRTDAMSRRMVGLDSSLSSSANEVEDIARSITRLSTEIHEQSTMVEQSTASVTEMIASLDNIAKIAETRRLATERLLALVAEGGRKMASTFEIVNRINQSVGSIGEITTVLEEISSETNLLAMNAAIEAAHAGEAGKGFGVVASEIRKLAEASTKNSREITNVLQQIIGGVSEAKASGDQLGVAYREISENASSLSGSLSDIFAGLGELSSGGSQILHAMTVLRDVSDNVTSGATSINESSASIRRDTADVQRTSEEVRNGLEEVARGVHEISTAVGGVLAIAQRLGEAGESLNRDLAKFKTA